MKVQMTLGSEVLRWEEVFLDRKLVQKLFQFLEKELRKSDVMNSALEELSVKQVGCLGLHFCGDREMRSLQKQYRKLDRTTDVLSFPSLEMPGIETLFQALPKEERSWGDLVVSLPTVKRGAQRGKRKPSVELLEVMTHGFLHLLGMDHVAGKGVSPKQAREMKALQKVLLKKFLKTTMSSL